MSVLLKFIVLWTSLKNLVFVILQITFSEFVLLCTCSLKVKQSRWEAVPAQRASDGSVSRGGKTASSSRGRGGHRLGHYRNIFSQRSPSSSSSRSSSRSPSPSSSRYKDRSNQRHRRRCDAVNSVCLLGAQVTILPAQTHPYTKSFPPSEGILFKVWRLSVEWKIPPPPPKKEAHKTLKPLSFRPHRSYTIKKKTNKRKCAAQSWISAFGLIAITVLQKSPKTTKKSWLHLFK